MSSSSNVSSHTRSRSLRVPPNVLKLVPHSQPTPGPSNIALFLTNLRLLNLDLRKDWPDITTLTFSTKDNQQNQKKRVQCVEWALYQLFVLWDSGEARNKLQPFFPPLEPLQSLNLRAALFRCLESAKKNGVLGRDTVLRKTMLDECKGEKVEEVLAVFSNVVLKKVIQETESSRHDALAQQLALENLSYTGERTKLSALILAHKASLSKYTRQKEESRARYKDFSDLLNLNERRIARRREQLKETIEQHETHDKIGGREAGALQDQVRQNWSGSPEWLESVLYGDSRASAEGLLAARFSKVWRHVETGSIGDIEGKHQVGLLEQLDARVKDQEDRLARWQDFGKSLAKVESSPPPKKVISDVAEPKKIDLGFNQHKTLQIGRSKENALKISGPSLEEYSRLIENMKSELADVGKAQAPSKRLPRQSLLSEKRRSSTMPSPVSASEVKEDSVQEEIEEDEEWSSASDMDELSPVSTRTPPKSSSPNILLKDSGVDMQSRDVSPEPPSPEPPLTMSPITRNVAYSPSRRRRTLPKKENSPSPEPIARTPSPIPEYTARTPSPIKVARPTYKTPPAKAALAPTMETESNLADQILNSLSTASPSPKKLRHTLSLAERTRLSMSRTTHSKFVELDDQFALEELPRLSINTTRLSVPPTTSNSESDGGALHAGLTERTRKSMAGFEAAQKRAQLERRRSIKDQAKKQKQRTSGYFPKVEEETNVGDTSVVELLEGDAGYEDVFKSRPKIATSPAALSPTKIWEEEDEE